MTNEKALECNHIGMVTNGFCGNCLTEGLGPDTPTHVNEEGIPQRFTAQAKTWEVIFPYKLIGLTGHSAVGETDLYHFIYGGLKYRWTLDEALKRGWIRLADHSSFDGLSADIPTHINEKGAAQSDIPYRADLLPGKALLHIAAILKQGADKYGANNWRDLETDDHINHALTHILAFIAGDTQDDHMGHAACRMMMALATELAE